MISITGRVTVRLACVPRAAVPSRVPEAEWGLACAQPQFPPPCPDTFWRRRGGTAGRRSEAATATLRVQNRSEHRSQISNILTETAMAATATLGCGPVNIKPSGYTYASHSLTQIIHEFVRSARKYLSQAVTCQAPSRALGRGSAGRTGSCPAGPQCDGPQTLPAESSVPVGQVTVARFS